MTRYPRRGRSGTSLLEALAAITLLTIGALGVAATGVASLRLETSADRRWRAASTVGNRLEQLHRSGCLSSAGTDSSLSVYAVWHATAAQSFQEIVDTVVVADRLAARPLTEVIQSAAPC